MNIDQTCSPDIAQLSAEDIRAMRYNDLIGLVRETNRFPGGRISLHRIASRLMLTPQTRLLEIGCATGSTSIELSRLVGLTPTAVDLNPRSLIEARRRAEEVGAHVEFVQADATKLPFEDGSFDVVICGNVTALIDDKNAAVAEYKRVLSEGGFLVAAPMYYRNPPATSLVDRVRAAIQVDIPVLDRDDALAFFYQIGLEAYDEVDFAFDDIPVASVNDFCRDILGRKHLRALSDSALEALREVYTSQMLLFRDNMAILGYTIIFLRKTRFIEDPELFVAREVHR